MTAKLALPSLYQDLLQPLAWFRPSLRLLSRGWKLYFISLFLFTLSLLLLLLSSPNIDTRHHPCHHRNRETGEIWTEFVSFKPRPIPAHPTRLRTCQTLRFSILGKLSLQHWLSLSQKHDLEIFFPFTTIIFCSSKCIKLGVIYIQNVDENKRLCISSSTRVAQKLHSDKVVSTCVYRWLRSTVLFGPGTMNAQVSFLVSLPTSGSENETAYAQSPITPTVYFADHDD